MASANVSDLSDARNVFKRTGENTMPYSAFMLLTGVFTMVALAITAGSSLLTLDWVAKSAETGKMEWVGPNMLLVFLGVFAVTMVGVVIAAANRNPFVKLAAYYGLLAFPFGLILGPVVAQYTEASIVKVVAITFGVTGVMSILGAVLPRWVQGLGFYLFGALTTMFVVLIVFPFVAPFLPSGQAQQAMTVIDWFGVVLFSGYVIYDVNRTRFIPATLVNAIDSSLSIYLDIENLFLYLLELYGKTKD